MVGLLQSLLTAVHLMAVSIAALGPLACLWLEWREHRHGDVAAGQTGRQLARLAMAMFWIGLLLGLAAFGLLWASGARDYLRAFSVIPARRIWFGLAELAFYVLCMAAYVRWWDRLPRWSHRSLAVLAATDLLYHFPPLFSAVVVISSRESLITVGRPLEYMKLMAVLGDSETLSRVTHVLLAGWVVTGVALMGLVLRRNREEPTTPRAAVWGGRLALVAALLQMPVGIWVLLNMPALRRDQLLAADLPATGLFGLGIVVMLGLLHHLAAVALGETGRTVLARCLALTALLFVLMVGAGQRARAVVSEPTPELHTVVPRSS